MNKPSVQFATRTMATHGEHKPMRVVLHDTESHDHAGIGDIKGIFDFWKRQGLGYGAHLVIDKSGNTGQGCMFKSIAWHVEGHNTGSIGIEQSGFARFTPKAWYLRRRQLRKVAEWLAYLSQSAGIPLVHSMAHGVCTHADFHGGHTDPGSGYPLKHVLRMARRIKARG